MHYQSSALLNCILSHRIRNSVCPFSTILYMKSEMLTVRPEIVDADVIEILVTCNFKFNPRATTKTASE